MISITTRKFKITLLLVRVDALSIYYVEVEGIASIWYLANATLYTTTLPLVYIWDSVYRYRDIHRRNLRLFLSLIPTYVINVQFKRKMPKVIMWIIYRICILKCFSITKYNIYIHIIHAPLVIWAKVSFTS